MTTADDVARERTPEEVAEAVVYDAIVNLADKPGFAAHMRAAIAKTIAFERAALTARDQRIKELEGENRTYRNNQFLLMEKAETAAASMRERCAAEIKDKALDRFTKVRGGGHLEMQTWMQGMAEAAELVLALPLTPAQPAPDPTPEERRANIDQWTSELAAAYRKRTAPDAGEKK